MASHLQTQNLELPLYEKNDTPSWLQDWNETMQKLDYYCSTLNSRLYDYVQTIDSINSQLTAGKDQLDEALKLSNEAKDLANSVSQSMNSVIQRVDVINKKVDNNYTQLTEQLTTFEGNFVPITQEEYDAMGSGRPDRVYLIVG